MPVQGISITLSKDLKAGTYQVVPYDSEVVPSGTAAKLREIGLRLKEIEDLLNKSAPLKVIPIPKGGMSIQERIEWWKNHPEYASKP